MSGYIYRGSELDTVCGDKQGTVTGAHRHRRQGQRPCGPCLAAERDYKRFYRANHATSSTTAEANRLRSRARQRALVLLRQAHPAEFGDLMRQELARVIEEAG